MRFMCLLPLLLLLLAPVAAATCCHANPSTLSGGNHDHSSLSNVTTVSPLFMLDDPHDLVPRNERQQLADAWTSGISDITIKCHNDRDTWITTARPQLGIAVIRYKDTTAATTTRATVTRNDSPQRLAQDLATQWGLGTIILPNADNNDTFCDNVGLLLLVIVPDTDAFAVGHAHVYTAIGNGLQAVLTDWNLRQVTDVLQAQLRYCWETTCIHQALDRAVQRLTKMVSSQNSNSNNNNNNHNKSSPTFTRERLLLLLDKVLASLLFYLLLRICLVLLTFVSCRCYNDHRSNNVVPSSNIGNLLNNIPTDKLKETTPRSFRCYKTECCPICLEHYEDKKPDHGSSCANCGHDDEETPLLLAKYTTMSCASSVMPIQYLDCGHVVCRPCWTHLVQSTRHHQAGHHQQALVQCPICRQFLTASGGCAYSSLCFTM